VLTGRKISSAQEEGKKKTEAHLLPRERNWGSCKEERGGKTQKSNLTARGETQPPRLVRKEEKKRFCYTGGERGGSKKKGRIKRRGGCDREKGFFLLPKRGEKGVSCRGEKGKRGDDRPASRIGLRRLRFTATILPSALRRRKRSPFHLWRKEKEHHIIS